MILQAPGFPEVEWGVWGYRSQDPSSTAPKGTRQPSSLYPTLPPLGHPPSLD